MCVNKSQKSIWENEVSPLTHGLSNLKVTIEWLFVFNQRVGQGYIPISTCIYIDYGVIETWFIITMMFVVFTVTYYMELHGVKFLHYKSHSFITNKGKLGCLDIIEY